MASRLDLFDGRVLTRAAEITAFDEVDGIVTGRAVPYDVEIELTQGLYESFSPGAFKAAAKDPGRVKMKSQEHGGEVIGHAVEVIDGPEGVDVRMKIVDTQAGSDVLKLLRAGSLDNLSIEYKAIPKGGFQTERRLDGLLVRHKRAHLIGVSPVSEGAYGKHAMITSVRHADAHEAEVQKAIAWLHHYRTNNPFRTMQ